MRDATGTVESIPLIVASILSKKLAEGLDALVLDVKTGSGAFMAAREDAQKLAEALVEVARGAGLDTVALITDMDEVLGTTAGNALEVRESVDHLTGASREPRLHEVTVALAAAALVQSRLAPDEDTARAQVQSVLDDGSAAETFGRMVSALGGPTNFVEKPELPAASVTRPVAPERPGYVDRVDARAVGLVVTGLGGNRRREDDQIDYGVGLSDIAPIGAAGRPGPPAGDRPRPRRPERDRGRDRAAAGRPRQRRAARRAPRAAGPRIDAFPLAELHVHLEGTVPPALIQTLADRNGLTVPEGVFAGPDRFQWVDFLDFLRTYDLAASVIRTRQDYRDITYAYLMGCAAEGAIYVELIVSPDHAASVGLSDEDHYGGIAQGIDDARATTGIEARMLATAIRNFGVEAADGHRGPRPPSLRRRLQPRRRRGGLSGGAVRARPTRSRARAASAARATRASTTGPSPCVRRSRSPASRASPTACAPSRTRGSSRRSPSAASCSRSARPRTSPRGSSRVTKLTL